MAKAVFRRRDFWLQPKPKGRPPMKTKKEIKTQVDSIQKSDKERIKELETENARLKV